MTRRECPASRSASKHFNSLAMSSKCKPVVGSSKMKSVCPSNCAVKCAASFTRCASPPDNVVAGCPSLRYPSPTSSRILSFCATRFPSARLLKKSIASFTVIERMSSTFFPLYRISRASFLYRFPLQLSHVRYKSAMNCISIFWTPSPSHVSHRPPGTLNEK